MSLLGVGQGENRDLDSDLEQTPQTALASDMTTSRGRDFAHIGGKGDDWMVSRRRRRTVLLPGRDAACGRGRHCDVQAMFRCGRRLSSLDKSGVCGKLG